MDTVAVPIKMTKEVWEMVEDAADAMLAGCVPEDREYNATLLDDARNYRLTEAVQQEVRDQVYLTLFEQAPQPKGS